MNRLLLSLFLFLIAGAASSEYVIYEKSDNRIIGTKSDSSCGLEQGAIWIEGKVDLKWLRTKKIVMGDIVEDANSDKKIVLTGDTEMPAGSDTRLLTLTLVNRYDTPIVDMDRKIKVRTTRGKLLTKQVQTINGVATFVIRGVDETIEILVTAEDKKGDFLPARHKIELVP